MSLSKTTKLVVVAKMLCRDLRKHSTEAEKIFWEQVRNRRFLNRKFYRQYPLFFDHSGKETFYIADFYCHQDKLVIEIDGGYHKRLKDYDRLRSEIINILGIRVIRFTNEEIKSDISNILKKLRNELSLNSP